MKVNTHHGSNLGSPTNYPPYGFTPENWNQGDRHSDSSWVHLLKSLSPFAYPEALLLCQHSEDEWIAWIPDYGETVLHRSQFCVNY